MRAYGRSFPLHPPGARPCRAGDGGPGPVGRIGPSTVLQKSSEVGHHILCTELTGDQVLAPGGRVSIQAITMPHDRMLATRDGHTWINKYIFPGGMLATPERFMQVAAGAGLAMLFATRSVRTTHLQSAMRILRRKPAYAEDPALHD